MRTSSSSTLNHSQVTELLPLSLRESPATLWRKLMSTACFSNLFFFSLSLFSVTSVTAEFLSLWEYPGLMKWLQNQSSTCDLGCPGAKCKYEHRELYVQTRWSLWTSKPWLRWSLPFAYPQIVSSLIFLTIQVAWRRQWSPRKGHLQSSHAYT